MASPIIVILVTIEVSFTIAIFLKYSPQIFVSFAEVCSWKRSNHRSHVVYLVWAGFVIIKIGLKASSGAATLGLTTLSVMTLAIISFRVTTLDGILLFVAALTRRIMIDSTMGL